MEVIDNTSAWSRYANSFPGLSPETPYVNWGQNLIKQGDSDNKPLIDLRKQIGADIMKALDITNMATGTQDRTLIPIYVDPSIIDITRKNTPLVELIPRVTNLGRTADYNRLTARERAEWKAEGAALSEQDDTCERASTAVKYIYATGKTTGPALAASLPYLRSGGYVDSLNLEITNKTVTIRETEEDTILNGNTTTDNNEFNGLRALISTNTLDKNGEAITIANLRDAIRACREGSAGVGTTGGGNPNLIVTDYKTVDDIKALVQNELRYPSPTARLAWGIETMVFEGVPIIASKHMPRTANARELLVLDTRVIEMRVLQDLTYEELAKTADFRKFMLKIYEALIVKAEEFCYKITELD